MATVVSVDDRTLQEVLRVDSEGRLLVSVKGGGGGNVDLSAYETAAQAGAKYSTKQEAAAAAAAANSAQTQVTALQGSVTQLASRTTAVETRASQAATTAQAAQTTADGLAPRVKALEDRPQSSGGVTEQRLQERTKAGALAALTHSCVISSALGVFSGTTFSPNNLPTGGTIDQSRTRNISPQHPIQFSVTTGPAVTVPVTGLYQVWVHNLGGTVAEMSWHPDAFGTAHTGHTRPEYINNNGYCDCVALIQANTPTVIGLCSSAANPVRYMVRVTLLTPAAPSDVVF